MCPGKNPNPYFKRIDSKVCRRSGGDVCEDKIHITVITVMTKIIFENQRDLPHRDHHVAGNCKVTFNLLYYYHENILIPIPYSI